MRDWLVRHFDVPLLLCLEEKWKLLGWYVARIPQVLDLNINDCAMGEYPQEVPS
jgi:hypothetical protein